MAGFADVLRVREFRALWLAEGLSVGGDQVARVALALVVFARTNSAALTALTYALTFVPAVLGGVLLSGLADRYPRRAVIVATDVVRGLLAAAMAVPGLPLWLLWGLVGVLTLASAPFKAAQLALLPDVLPGPLFQAGMGLRQIPLQAVQVAGRGAAGRAGPAAGHHRGGGGRRVRRGRGPGDGARAGPRAVGQRGALPDERARRPGVCGASPGGAGRESRRPAGEDGSGAGRGV